MRIIEGNFQGKERRVCIAVSRFNDIVAGRLLEGALDGLGRHGVEGGQITVLRVPGAWELPMVCQRAARSGRFDGIIALGAVIRGESAHFDYVCAEVSKGVASVGMEGKLPVIFGVLTCNHLQEALDRAGGKAGNKGFDAAMACLEMMSLSSVLDEQWAGLP